MCRYASQNTSCVPSGGKNMKLILASLGLAILATSTIAQDLTTYDHFFHETLEEPYSANWYVKYLGQDGDNNYFSVIADGKLVYEGVYITACATRTDLEDKSISTYDAPSDEVINALLLWICTS